MRCCSRCLPVVVHPPQHAQQALLHDKPFSVACSSALDPFITCQTLLKSYPNALTGNTAPLMEVMAACSGIDNRQQLLMVLVEAKTEALDALAADDGFLKSLNTWLGVRLELLAGSFHSAQCTNNCTNQGTYPGFAVVSPVLVVLPCTVPASWCLVGLGIAVSSWGCLPHLLAAWDNTSVTACTVWTGLSTTDKPSIVLPMWHTDNTAVPAFVHGPLMFVVIYGWSITQLCAPPTLASLRRTCRGRARAWSTW